MLDESGRKIVEAAEAYIRELAASGDLGKQRVRRRLRLAVAELSRIRQVFAEDEHSEALEIGSRTQLSDVVAMALPVRTVPGENDGDLPEADDELEGTPVRVQPPNASETSVQTLTRELISALSPLMETFRSQNETSLLRARLERADAVLRFESQISLAKKDGDPERVARLQAMLEALSDGKMPSSPDFVPLPLPANEVLKRMEGALF